MIVHMKTNKFLIIYKINHSEHQLTKNIKILKNKLFSTLIV
jgi:hypothetical protein